MRNVEREFGSASLCMDIRETCQTRKRTRGLTRFDLCNPSEPAFDIVPRVVLEEPRKFGRVAVYIEPKQARAKLIRCRSHASTREELYSHKCHDRTNGEVEDVRDDRLALLRGQEFPDADESRHRDEDMIPAYSARSRVFDMIGCRCGTGVWCVVGEKRIS